MSHLREKIARAYARGDIKAAKAMERIEAAERRQKKEPK